MKFKDYVMKEEEEDIVQKALNLDEPEMNEKYDKEFVNKRIEIIKSALEKVRSENIDDKIKEAKITDLEDKLDKWSNLNKEKTEPQEEEGEEKKLEGERKK